MKVNSFLLLIVVFIISSYKLLGQCEITASAKEICRGNTVNFHTSTSAFKYEWHSGTGLIENKQNATFIFDQYGIFYISCIFYDTNNVEFCRDSVQLRVFDLPVADITDADTIFLCGDEQYCFKNNSKPGADNAKITNYLWLFGDGDISEKKDPCHIYSTSGEFLLFLNVKDTNQCEAHIEKKTKVVLVEVEADFITNYSDSCPVTTVTFVNQTTVLNDYIKSVYWDFGDGTSDTINSMTFKRKYKTDGFFDPIMFIETAQGCKDSFICYGCASNIIFNFDITANPKESCFVGNEIQFKQTPSEVVGWFLWDFGDTAALNKTYNSVSWFPKHHFTIPGVFDVSFHIRHGDCIKDTTLCDFIKITGPLARINLPKYNNDCNNERPMPVSLLDISNSKCFNANQDSIIYVKREVVPKYVRKKINTFCNADTSFIYKNVTPCGVDSTIFLGPPNLTRYEFDTIKEFINYYKPGDPLPTGDIYFLNEGNCHSFNMHDTDLVILDCSGPNYVKFTNNSIKFRLYKAIDNFPPYKYGSQGSDECKNPSFPWASDSLDYFWDFGEGQSCTSTVINKNIRCRYSTEVAPWHLYEEDGCYIALLKVYDSITGCKSRDSVRIIMEPPYAGYDTVKYSYMNWVSQQYFDLPNRGFMLAGSPCTTGSLCPDFSETFPTCERQDWGVIFDSVSQCDKPCNDTVYFDRDGNNIIDTVVYKTVNCGWIDKDSFNRAYPNCYTYGDAGCKTIGVWIKTGDCIDTFWYHNYIYISALEAMFNILSPDDLEAYDLNFNTSSLYVCAPYFPILTANFKGQRGITEFSYEITMTNSPPGTTPVYITAKDTLIADTAYYICNKQNIDINPATGDTIFYNCTYYPSFGCDDDKFNYLDKDTLLKYFSIRDTLYLLSLEDTLYLKDSFWQPGNYSIKSTIKNMYGCYRDYNSEFNIGFQTNLTATDTIVCLGDSIILDAVNSFYSQRSTGANLHLQWDLDDDGVFELNDTNYLKLIFTKPGITSVRVKVYDSMCNIEKEIYKKAFINSLGVFANFDTLNSPSVCAPEIVGFRDLSQLIKPYSYKYDSLGNIIDSTIIDFIYLWDWEFGDHKGIHSKSFKQHPKHAYTANGLFDVMLKVKTIQGCKDSLYLKDYIKIEGPHPEFQLLDTLGCVPFTVRVVNLSQDVSSWIWEQGDGIQHSGTYNYGDTILLTYNNPGTFYIKLTGSDSVFNPYFNTFTRCTSIFPDPYDQGPHNNKVVVRDIDISGYDADTMICSGESILFKDFSDPDYDSVLWYFSDNRVFKTGILGSFTRDFNLANSTIFDSIKVKHQAMGAFCPDEPKEFYIRIYDVITESVYDSNLEEIPVFCFRNFSQGGTKYLWTFEDGDPKSLIKKTEENVCSNFKNHLGTKKVCLYGENEIGCKDTSCVEIENDYKYFIYIPNIFTPGLLDDKNDRFKISSLNIEKYDLTIYNRWGEIVFVSQDPDYHWDGLDYESGEPCSAGAYYVILNYNFRYLEPETYHGTCTLVR